MWINNNLLLCLHIVTDLLVRSRGGTDRYYQSPAAVDNHFAACEEELDLFWAKDIGAYKELGLQIADNPSFLFYIRCRSNAAK